MADSCSLSEETPLLKEVYKVEVNDEFSDKKIKELRILQAKVLTEDALNGRSLKHLMDLDSLKRYNFYYSRPARIFRCCVVLSLFFITLGELPQTFVMPLWIPRAVEFSALSFLILDILFLWSVRTTKQMVSITQIIVYLAIIASVTDALVDLFTVYNYIRCLRVLRPFLLFHVSNSFVLLNRSLVNIIGHLIPIFVALTLTILWFVMLTVVVFDDDITDDIVPDVFQGFVNFFILLTTSNCPDIFIEAFNHQRSSFLLFFAFTAFTIFFLMSILQATIADYFLKQVRILAGRKIRKRMKGLLAGFSLIDTISQGYNTIDFPTFNKFTDSLKLSDNELPVILFQLADADESGTLDRTEFANIFDLFFSDIKSKRSYRISALGQKFPRLHNLLISVAFDRIIDFIIFLTFILLIIRVDLNARNKQATVVTYISNVCISLAFILCLTKLIIVGLYSTLSRKGDQWLMLSVFFVFVVQVFMAPFTTYSSIIEDISIMSFLIWILIMIRVVSLIPFFDTIIQASVRVVPGLLPLFGMMFGVFYIYMIFGMSFFAFSATSPEGRELLKDSDYEKSNYFPFGFDDAVASFVTVWIQMVGNNWQVWMDAYVIVTSELLSRAYFFSFYLIVTMFVGNVVFAYLLEAVSFTNDKEKVKYIVNTNDHDTDHYTQSCTNLDEISDDEDEQEIKNKPEKKAKEKNYSTIHYVSFLIPKKVKQQMTAAGSLDDGEEGLVHDPFEMVRLKRESDLLYDDAHLLEDDSHIQKSTSKKTKEKDVKVNKKDNKNLKHLMTTTDSESSLTRNSRLLKKETNMIVSSYFKDMLNDPNSTTSTKNEIVIRRSSARTGAAGIQRLASVASSDSASSSSSSNMMRKAVNNRAAVAVSEDEDYDTFEDAVAHSDDNDDDDDDDDDDVSLNIPNLYECNIDDEFKSLNNGILEILLGIEVFERVHAERMALLRSFFCLSSRPQK